MTDGGRVTPQPRPIPGLEVRAVIPGHVPDPLAEAARAAQKGGFGLLAQDRKALDGIVAAALAAAWVEGEMDAVTRVSVPGNVRVITPEYRQQAVARFLSMVHAAGLGLVSSPHVALRRGEGRAAVVVSARTQPLRPAPQPADAAAS